MVKGQQQYKCLNATAVEVSNRTSTTSCLNATVVEVSNGVSATLCLNAAVAEESNIQKKKLVPCAAAFIQTTGATSCLNATVAVISSSQTSLQSQSEVSPRSAGTWFLRFLKQTENNTKKYPIIQHHSCNVTPPFQEHVKTSNAKK